MKKAERKTWKVAMLGREQSDKRLRKLQAAANKGHETIETSFRQLGGKPKRALKGDLNQIAANIVAQSTGEDDRGQFTVQFKNPAAVELGRLGGQKGGKARAKNLSPERRKKIASKAAKARWKKRKRSN